MFVNSLKESEGANVSVIGEFVTIKGQHAILRVDGSEILVTHKGLEKYKSKYLLVNGTVQAGCLIEENVYSVEDNFDINTFKRLVAATGKYQSLF